MRFAFLLAASVLLLVAPSRAEWTVTSSQSAGVAASGVEHWHIVLNESTSGDEATVELAIFSTKSATLRVLDDPDGAEDLASIMVREHCLAGVNGGYFDPQHAPVGLLVSHGEVIAPLRKAKLLSGVVNVINGRLRIQRSTEFSVKSKPTEARQCGPFLVDQGKAIAELNNTRAARRTFVVTGSGERAALGYCTHVTLAQLGDLLTAPELIPKFKIQRALNLDGGSSSGFWFTGPDGVFSIREQKTVRDYLAIVPRP